jgi:hypothetical protein
MKIINTRAELVALAAELGVRADWHEPDEQGLIAIPEGFVFDNAGFWPDRGDNRYRSPDVIEQHIILRQHGKDVAAVNLATLFAWATGLDR